MNKSFEIREIIKDIIKERVEKRRKQSLVLFQGFKKSVGIHNSQMSQIGPKSKHT